MGNSHDSRDTIHLQNVEGASNSSGTQENAAIKKTVLVGVTGGIAAYKSCVLVRDLQKQGFRVKVAMTEHATNFVDPLTFRSLTHEQVAVGLFDDPEDPIHHISLADEADLFCVAPCTANFLAKLAYGIADDLLSTTALAMTCPIVIAPAMNIHMYENPATQHNMQVVSSRGIHIVEAGSGYLACGYTGKGRMAEPEEITSAIVSILNTPQDYQGKRVLITAGPTHEPIDPVRFISNRSSGKMGFALARCAHARGAEVTLVTGPSQLSDPAGVHVIRVETAEQMFDACDQNFEACDFAIFAAAVSDMRPARIHDHKMKKNNPEDDLSEIHLVENPDILKTLALKCTHQKTIGFAAETNDILENARRKLDSKHADMIVANQVSETKTFGANNDEAWLITHNGETHIPETSKDNLSNKILDAALKL